MASGFGRRNTMGCILHTVVATHSLLLPRRKPGNGVKMHPHDGAAASNPPIAEMFRARIFVVTGAGAIYSQAV